MPIFEAFGLLGCKIRVEFRRFQFESSSRDHHRIGNQLRRGALRIKIAQDAIEAGFRKRHAKQEFSVRLHLRMRMLEELEILAYNEQVIQLLVNNLEILDGLEGFGILNVERKLRFLPCLEHLRPRGNANRKLLWLR